MKIRLVKENEVEAASKIVGANYSKLYQRLSRLEIRAMFKNCIPPKYFVAEDNGKIIGITGYTQSWMDYRIYQIFWVNVLSKYQKRGIGTALVKRVLHDIKKKRGRNRASIILLSTYSPEFYYKFGFETLIKFRKKSCLMILNLERHKQTQ